MSFLQTSQCQEKSSGWGSPTAVIPEMCPRKARTVPVRSPPLSPGLRQPPAPLLALLRVATERSPGASRGQSHLWYHAVTRRKRRWKLDKQSAAAPRRLRGPVKRAAMANRRKHLSGCAERSAASWRGQAVSLMCEDVDSSSDSVSSH